MYVAGESKKEDGYRWQMVVIFPEAETMWVAAESGMHSCSRWI